MPAFQALLWFQSAWGWLFDRVDLGRPVADLVDRERSGLLAEHAGRARRHAGQGDALDVRALGQEADHRTDRYMALDHVTVDQRRVAALERFGHAVLASGSKGRSWVGFTVTSKPLSRR